MEINIDVIKVGYSSFDPVTNVMKADCTCTLVQDDDVNVLVDTLSAWDSSYLISELQRRQVSCSKVDYVVCTHGHSDHVGNLNLFNNAELIVGQSICNGDEYKLHPFDENIPYVLTQNIEVIPTPGHTLSDVSVLVKNSVLGTVVIAGDLFEKKEDIENPELWKKIAGSENHELQYKNREKVLAIADYIIPGHGPMFQVTEMLKASHSLTNVKNT